MFEGVDQLEKSSEFIVNAKFSGKRTLHNWMEGDDVVETASKTQIEIRNPIMGI